MPKKLDIEKIQDRKVIPSVILVILFFIFAFFFINFIKIPSEPKKPNPDIFIKFNPEVRRIKQEEKKKKEKKQEERKEEKVVEVDEPLPDEEVTPEINPEEFEDITDDFDPTIKQEIYEPVPIIDENINPNEAFGDPGDYGEIEDFANVDIDAAFAGGVDRGGAGDPGFNPDLKEATIGTRRNPELKPGRRRPKVERQKGRPIGYDSNIQDYIEPIITWMEQHPYPLSNTVKIQMNYAPGDLTSRAVVQYEGITYVMFLLCKKEIKQLGILFADFESEEYALIKDAGLIKQAGYLLIGRFMKAKDDIIDVDLFDGRREKASSAAGNRYNGILWKWFERVQ